MGTTSHAERALYFTESDHDAMVRIAKFCFERGEGFLSVDDIVHSEQIQVKIGVNVGRLAANLVDVSRLPMDVPPRDENGTVIVRISEGGES